MLVKTSYGEQFRRQAPPQMRELGESSARIEALTSYQMFRFSSNELPPAGPEPL